MYEDLFSCSALHWEQASFEAVGTDGAAGKLGHRALLPHSRGTSSLMLVPVHPGAPNFVGAAPGTPGRLMRPVRVFGPLPPVRRSEWRTFGTFAHCSRRQRRRTHAGWPPIATRNAWPLN